MIKPKTISDGTNPPMVVEAFQTTTYGMELKGAWQERNL